jgi:ammonium transporter, Amt family
LSSPSTVDIGWLLFCAALVLFMQAGFTALESGLVRSKNSINVAFKNFANFLVAAALFWLFGFGLMFGADEGGVIGTTSFVYEGDTAFLTAFFLFQLGFIGTATTLMSGAVAERMRFSG